MATHTKTKKKTKKQKKLLNRRFTRIEQRRQAKQIQRERQKQQRAKLRKSFIAKIPKILKDSFDRSNLAGSKYSEQCFYEMCILYTTNVRRGICCFNQDRLAFSYSADARKKFVKFIDTVTEKLSKGQARGLFRSDEYTEHELEGRSIQRCFHWLEPKAPTVHGTGVSCGSPAPSVSTDSGCHACNENPSREVGARDEWVEVVIPKSFLKERRAKWAEACEHFDWNEPNSVGDEDLLIRHVKNTTDLLVLPDPEVFKGQTYVKDGVKRCVYTDYLEQLRDGQYMVPRFIHGRMYHGITNLSKVVRRDIKIWHNGRLERLAEVDIHACYWSILAAWAKDDAAMAELSHRTWYDQFGGDKVGAQMHTLFRKGWYQHEYRDTLQRNHPKIAKLIESMKDQFRDEYRDPDGNTGLSHMLTAAEGDIMLGGVASELAQQGLPCLPLHDAMLVPESEAEKVAELVRKHCKRVLGFAPAVRAK